jgi:hypothetical protein
MRIDWLWKGCGRREKVGVEVLLKLARSGSVPTPSNGSTYDCLRICSLTIIYQRLDTLLDPFLEKTLIRLAIASLIHLPGPLLGKDISYLRKRSTVLEQELSCCNWVNMRGHYII